MGEVRIETQIEASPEAVWTVLGDMASWESWNEVIVDGRCDGGVGSKLHCKVDLGLILFPVDSPAKKWEEARVIEWGDDIGKLAMIRHGFTLEARDGGTWFAHYESFEGPVGRLAFRMLKRTLMKNYAAFNQALKRRVEG